MTGRALVAFLERAFVFIEQIEADERAGKGQRWVSE